MATVWPRDADQVTELASTDRIGAWDASEDKNVYIEKDDLSSTLGVKDLVEVWNDGGADNIATVNISALSSGGTGLYYISARHTDGGSTRDFTVIFNIKSTSLAYRERPWTAGGSSTDTFTLTFNEVTANSFVAAVGGSYTNPRITSIDKFI